MAFLIPSPPTPQNKEARKTSLASLAVPDLFPYSLPASCGALAPFRLCSRRQPQSSPWDPTEAGASAPSPRPLRRVSRQASRAGECWSAPILCAGISLLCPPHPCCCALLHGSKASLLHHPQPPPAKGLPSVWKPFLLHNSLPLVHSCSYSFVSVFSFSFFPTQVCGVFLAFWEVFCQRSVGVL